MTSMSNGFPTKALVINKLGYIVYFICVVVPTAHMHFLILGVTQLVKHCEWNWSHFYLYLEP